MKDIERAEIQELRDALRQIMDELGVPGDDYPAPVANAYEIARRTLGPQPTQEAQAVPDSTEGTGG